MVVEPLLEDLDGLLGEVAAALAAGRAAALVSRAPVGVLLRRGVLVRRRAGVALTLANCREREELIQFTSDKLQSTSTVRRGATVDGGMISASDQCWAASPSSLSPNTFPSLPSPSFSHSVCWPDSLSAATSPRTTPTPPPAAFKSLPPLSASSAVPIC